VNFLTVTSSVPAPTDDLTFEETWGAHFGIAEKLTKMAEDIVEKEKSGQVCAIRIDCGDSKSVKEAFEAVNSLGPVEALVYNTNTAFPWPPPKFTEINVESFQRSITIPCVGAFLCVQQVIQGMVERQKGTLLFTGATASMRGGAGFSGIGVIFFLSVVCLPSNELPLFPNF
jgi:NADP-dependent 3-hydroxy acid dehydrogenase YdfG